ncbi:hypothetical protein [Pontibacter fetidus]|uniref:YceI-like domain-containing protein n=1 Tax=Pontibacter fetidus TaxID=2700082 RepID=A0A6B2GZK3_9BACT|nr:hypothetical protein [Pontibacter fetidus]NDK55471.1 hypothetical protein [Pontibacter fetidus]
MPATPLRYQIALLLIFMLAFNSVASAQAQRAYTSNNYITIVLEGPKGRYEFKSQDLLVRYNRLTDQLECSVMVNSLAPTSDTIPASMAYEVLYGAKFPEFAFQIDVPEEIISSGKPYPEPLTQRTYITLQGITNQTRIPIVFAPDRNRLSFGTNFDLRLSNFDASIPVRYIPVLTGRLLINISNARWIDQY